MKAYAYMLSCGDGSFYTGWTNNLTKRLAAHSSGRGAKYTRSHLPVRLVYYEAYPDKYTAMRRECEIKKLSHQEKTSLCRNFDDKFSQK